MGRGDPQTKNQDYLTNRLPHGYNYITIEGWEMWSGKTCTKIMALFEPK